MWHSRPEFYKIPVVVCKGIVLYFSAFIALFCFHLFLCQFRFSLLCAFFVGQSLWVVLSHDSVKSHVYFSTFLLLTAAFNVDSSVGTFSESIPRRATRLLTLISADSGWFCNLLVLDPLLGVPFGQFFLSSYEA